MYTKLPVLFSMPMLIGLQASSATALGAGTGAFEDVSLSVVYSASDEDAQIIIAGGSDEPLVMLRITGPGGTAAWVLPATIS